MNAVSRLEDGAVVSSQNIGRDMSPPFKTTSLDEYKDWKQVETTSLALSKVQKYA